MTRKPMQLVFSRKIISWRSNLHKGIWLESNFATAQREKLLDKQLHSLIEQLAAKQVDFTIYYKLATTCDFCINVE